MQKSVDARYDFGLTFVRLMAHNGDGTIPTSARTLGGVGPFDFSSIAEASRAAIPIHYKIGSAAVVNDSIDLSGSAVVDIAAVTLTELLAAFTASALVGIACTKDTETNRLKVALSTPDATKALQLWGKGFELAGIGQGHGTRFIKIDTAQSLADEATQKADETKSVTDAEGQDTSVILPGYTQGGKITIVDTAHDYRLRALLTGGIWDETAEHFEEPLSTSIKPTFFIEYFWAAYKKGTNKFADRVGYKKRVVRSCQGSTAKPDSHAADMGKWTYEINATEYLDETEKLNAYAGEDLLELDEYEALGLAAS